MGEKDLSEMVINDMKVEDLPEILAIENASFETPWSETLFYNELFKAVSVTRVARIGRRVAGYLCANIIIDEGHILNLAVHPDFRGGGIASRLIEEIISVMRAGSCRSVFLEVRVSNETARKMYEKFGFALLGTRKAYYLSPVEDAVVMVLRLT
ncbi:MAG: ribosomal protein S18-alanine N-acetyltransferase [Nitrospirota bacterium]|nr:ribosomal protein S18-alanine N-acetyltransferase [Nitrospirota bacterium]